MNKINRLWLYVHLLFLGVFNTLFFMLKGVDNLPSVWISYGAIHLAYLLAWRPFLSPRGVNLFGISLRATRYTYFCLELIVGIAFIIIEPQNWKVAFVCQFILLAIFLLPKLFLRMGGQYAQEGEPMLDELARNAKKMDYEKLARTKLDILLRGTLDMELRKQVAEVIDFLASRSLRPEKNTSKLMDYTTNFVTVVGSKDLEAVETAKIELMDYVM